MMTKNNLYLASKSPRRSELLTQIGISFTALAVDIDEVVTPNELAQEYVLRLAKEKALAGWNSSEEQDKAVLGSDTTVVVNGEILGKPENHLDAKRMLRLLSGKTHKVMTAVALAMTPADFPLNNKPELSSVINVNEVSFKELTDTDIEQYVDSGECDDKAGSYAIQGLAAVYITHLSGSYSGVMGLPLYETLELLNNAGIRQDSLVVS